MTVTEVLAQNPGLLKINNCSQIIKLRPHNRPLGKKGDGILLFVGEYIFPKVIHSPIRSDYDEIIWASVRPKFLPRPFHWTVFWCFYYSPNQNAAQRQRFLLQLHSKADFVLCKFPNAGVFLVGDANDIKLNSLCNSLNLKQIVKIPTTKVNTTLDLGPNMYTFYCSPVHLPPLGGSYNFRLLMKPLSKYNHIFLLPNSLIVEFAMKTSSSLDYK